MSKANKLASLAVDVNNLSELADQVTDIENAIVRANTNAQVIEGIADDIEALEANTADIMNDFASISNVFNSGITYSTDGENEYYDANSVTNTVATVDIIEMNIQNPQDGELLSYSTSANTWVNSPAPVIPEMPEIPEIPPRLETFRNKFINGDFSVWQRGTTFPAGNLYTADHWWIANDVKHFERSVDVPAGTGFSFSLRAESNGGWATFGQPIELLSTGISGPFIAGKTYTISFWGKVNSNTLNTGVNLYYRNSKFDGTNQAIPTTTNNTVTLTTEWQRFSCQYIFPQINSTNKILAFEIGIVGIGYFTGFQIEEGEEATPFEHRPYTTELNLCRRYYQRLWIGHEGNFSGFHSQMVTFPVPMRIAPTITEQFHDGNNVSAIYFDFTQPEGFWFKTDAPGGHYRRSIILADAEL